MKDEEFRVLLDLLMVSDPWPLAAEEEEVLTNLVGREAKERGYQNWIHAYHEFQKGKA